MGNDRRIGGHLLHSEEFGSAAKPSVLSLHGGPGMGAYHFETFQAPRLEGGLHLVTMDQRGVLRSAPLPDGEPLGVMDLVADAEALRHALGIERWSLIGHSFGGYLAVRYALTHPAAVDRLVLENASLDPASSARSLLTAAALAYAAADDRASARSCLASADAPADTPPAYLWDELTRWLAGLGVRRDDLYIHGERRRIVDEVSEAAPFPADWWRRGGVHQARLIQEGEIFRPLIGHLGGLLHRTLLIKGRYDNVFAADQIAGFLAAKPDSELHVYEASGHFAHMEESGRFAEEVLAFLAAPSP